jgi:hypothetical protein
MPWLQQLMRGERVGVEQRIIRFFELAIREENDAQVIDDDGNGSSGNGCGERDRARR